MKEIKVACFTVDLDKFKDEYDGIPIEKIPLLSDLERSNASKLASS